MVISTLLATTMWNQFHSLQQVQIKLSNKDISHAAWYDIIYVQKAIHSNLNNAKGVTKSMTRHRIVNTF